MRILSKYVLREFAVFLIYSILAFLAIFILVDAVELLGEFIDDKVHIYLIVLNYLFYLPYIFVLTLPVAMLLTTMFSLGRLVSDNELTAMKASGVSLYRILLPLYAFALLLGLVVMGLSEYVVPTANRYREDIQTQKNAFRLSLLRNRELDQAHVFVINGDGSVIYAREYNASNQMASGVFLVEPERRELPGGEESAALSRRIDAAYMQYDNSGWTMVNAVIRTFTADGEMLERHETLPAPFISAGPSDFAHIDITPEEMNYFQLKTYVDSIRSKGGDPTPLLVNLYLKIAFPFASFIIVFFGAPLAAGSSRRGKASAFGLALAVCFVYYTLVHGCQILGRNASMDPVLAAWLPNSLFFTIGGLLHVSAQK